MPIPELEPKDLVTERLDTPDTGYPYVAIPQLRGGRVELRDVRRITREHFLEWARKAKPSADDLADFEGVEPERLGKGVVVLTLQVKGKRPVSHLIASLAEIDGRPFRRHQLS